MEEIVSEFIVGTCRMLPRSSTNVFDSMHSIHEIHLKLHLIKCGSRAEFFILPLQSCIGDVDILAMKLNSLAFIDEKPVLPYDVRHVANTIDCLLMEPYPYYPGFVRLKLLGQISYNSECKTFEYIQASVKRILKTAEMEESERDGNDGKWLKVGPASRGSYSDVASVTTDRVKCIWCPQWPNEAKQWPTRQRKYGWPTTAIIHEVVQNGCHVVFAKHPACRNEEYQCRLSFSVAEVILLQSWTKAQQVVYHMLRFFAKQELIRKDCPKKDEVLCTYHLKTLMLWSCEEMLPEWWNTSSVVKLCSILLEKLAKWLKGALCPNYFIPQANLFHEHLNLKIVDETIKKITSFCNSNILSVWFVEHYMQPDVLNVFEAKSTHNILSREYLVETREAMKANYPKYIDYYFSIRFHMDMMAIRVAEGDIAMEIMISDLVKCSLIIFPPFEEHSDFLPSARYNSSYRFYGSMLRLLQIAHLMCRVQTDSDIEYFFQNIKAVSRKTKYIISKYHYFSKPSEDDTAHSQVCFLTAMDLMENLTGSRDHPEFQIVSAIANSLLIYVSECEDSETHAFSKANLSYLAALRFSASEYEVVTDLCSRVIMNETVADEETETLDAGCLLYIEDIATIIGFYLIFMKIKYSLYYTRRQLFLDLRLTPEVFAQYLRMMAIERIDGAVEPIVISQNPTFPLDAILMAITSHRFSQISEKRKNALGLCNYTRINPVNTFKETNESNFPNEEDFINWVIELSLEHMTSFYSAICKDFDIHCNTAECYRASYLHKCRKYPEVLALCERILGEPDLPGDLKEFAFANVMVLPPLDLFFDTDVQCLLGIQTLAYYLLPSNEGLRERGVSDLWTLGSKLAKLIRSCKQTLSEVLQDPYILKSNYFLGRHFLARYLKVRCLIDCNCSSSEVMIEFKKLKACLPFEQIMCYFLQQKLRQVQNILDSQAEPMTRPRVRKTRPRCLNDVFRY